MCTSYKRQDEYLVAYFDILGFKDRVKNNQLDSVVSKYKSILQENQKKSEPRPDLKGFSHHWFSDTFLFLFRVEEGNFREKFNYMMYWSKDFFHKMTVEKWALRGALTLGELYAEPNNNIFLGQALIDAYHHAEKQNWLGLVLTPTIIERIKELSCEKLNSSYKHYFVQYDVPCKDENRNLCTHKLFALKLHKFNNGVPRSSRDYDIWSNSSIMKQNAPEKAWVKYDNTTEFMLKNCQTLRDIVQREPQKPVPESTSPS